MSWINEKIKNLERREVEELLTTTLYFKPWYREHFFFNDRDFTDAELREVAMLILSSPAEIDSKEVFSYLVSKGVSLKTLHRLDSVPWMDDVAMFGPVAFKALANRLRDAMVKEELDRRLHATGNSLEILEYAHELAALKNTYDVNSLQQIASEFYDDYVDRQAKSQAGESVFVDTGITRFDQHVRMEAGDFIVLGARTSIGKTMFALWIALRAAARGHKVMYINLEMGQRQMMNRILAMVSRKQISDFKYLKANIDASMAGIDPILQNFYLESGSSMTSDDVRSLMMAKGKIDLVVVDYINLLTDKGEHEHQRLGKIANRFKEYAKAKNCVVMTLSQLNRESEKLQRAPELYDIRDSDVIASAADTVLLLSKEERKSNHVTLNIPKSRNGEIWNLAYLFDPDHSQYREL